MMLRNGKRGLQNQLKKRFQSNISYILGIETSCDDTAAAIVDSNGCILSEVISSQWDIVNKYKGIVPGLSARAHEENLPIVLEETLRASGLKDFRQLSAVAVTTGPGLAPCLNVGLKSAIEISETYKIDFLSINHLEAHALVPRLFYKDVEFPFLILLVSGGHCCLVLAKNVGDYEILGNTVDDSVGEAFDKVARMLELSREEVQVPITHGGKLVESFAIHGNAKHYPLTEPMKHRKV